MKIAGLFVFALTGAAYAIELSAGAAPVAARAANQVARSGPVPMPVAARDSDQVAKRAPRRLDTDFTKRQNCLSTTCRCNGVPGLFCGDESVNVACWNTNVYQCYEGGSSCDAGFDYPCAECHGLDC